MEKASTQAELLALGAQLANHVRSKGYNRSNNIATLQSMVSDLTAGRPDLGPPLKDLVSRAGFQALIPLAASGKGELQQMALVEEVGRIYQADVTRAIQQVLQGFLGLPRKTESGVITSSKSNPKEFNETDYIDSESDREGLPAVVPPEKRCNDVRIASHHHSWRESVAMPSRGNRLRKRNLSQLGFNSACAAWVTIAAMNGLVFKALGFELNWKDIVQLLTFPIFSPVEWTPTRLVWSIFLEALVVTICVRRFLRNRDVQGNEYVSLLTGASAGYAALSAAGAVIMTAMAHGSSIAPYWLAHIGNLLVIWLPIFYVLAINQARQGR